MRLRYTPKALRQLDEIYSYIEKHDPSAAINAKALIKRRIDQLARFPFLSRVTEHAGVRVLPIVRYPYLVFYTIDEAAQEIRILRVRHSSRDPKRHLD